MSLSAFFRSLVESALTREANAIQMISRNTGIAEEELDDFLEGAPLDSDQLDLLAEEFCVEAFRVIDWPEYREHCWRRYLQVFATSEAVAAWSNVRLSELEGSKLWPRVLQRMEAKWNTYSNITFPIAVAEGRMNAWEFDKFISLEWERFKSDFVAELFATRDSEFSEVLGDLRAKWIENFFRKVVASRTDWQRRLLASLVQQDRLILLGASEEDKANIPLGESSYNDFIENCMEERLVSKLRPSFQTDCGVVTHSQEPKRLRDAKLSDAISLLANIDRRQILPALRNLGYLDQQILRLLSGLTDGYNYTEYEVCHIFKVREEDKEEVFNRILYAVAQSLSPLV